MNQNISKFKLQGLNEVLEIDEPLTFFDTSKLLFTGKAKTFLWSAWEKRGVMADIKVYELKENPISEELKESLVGELNFIDWVSDEDHFIVAYDKAAK